MAPSNLNKNDHEQVRRVVPSASNEILGHGVARLYVNYPDRNRWTYTGISGCLVLANDKVGKTHFFKIVDISPANRGVLWDQELYEGLQYNQDRTFFHSFEIEDCSAGFSFTDEKEAEAFRKRVLKIAPPLPPGARQHQHSQASAPKPRARDITQSHAAGYQSHSGPPTKQPEPSSAAVADDIDPSWQPLLAELYKHGITDEMIRNNSEFIRKYVEDNRASLSGHEAPDTSNGGVESQAPLAAPPPPPPPPPPTAPAVPTNVPASRPPPPPPTEPPSSAPSRRNPPPPPPTPRRTQAHSSMFPDSHPEPISPPPRESSPKPSPFQFRVPPPLQNAGVYAERDPPKASQPPGSAPPPLPPKIPHENQYERSHVFAVPPPFPKAGSAVRPVPAPPQPRGQAPPPPPPRGSSIAPPVPSRNPPAGSSPSLPPPRPPVVANNFVPSAAPPPPPRAPPPTAASGFSGPPPPPAPPPPPIPGFNSSNAPPAPPPPPPPPALPGFGAGAGAPPPPPPPPPPAGLGGGPPAAASGQPQDLLASIRNAGGASALKKPTVVNDRSQPVTGANGGAEKAAGSGADVGGAGLGDALQRALANRKKKISKDRDSDDDDDDNGWD